MNCPWCDAKPDERPHANPDEWECGSFMRGERRYQTDGCRVRQADKQIAELSRQRDEALRMYRRAKQQRDEAMKTLQQYGRHRPECCSHRWNVTSDRVAHECDCGLAAGMARVKGEQE